MNNDKTIKLIKQTIKKLRPYLNADGGDLDFVKFEDGIVYVRLLGACIGCSSSDDTITNSVEALLLEEVPGVIGVEVVEEESI
ncbi:MAG TPA: NifU family protein [Acholeplasmatales bacterium]|jgi:nifU-like protein|nr:NifU family protein [Bacilli bacterium]MBS6562655.1 NifU family protein [Staphylococcus sp.]CDC70983.1 nifU-like protein [Staphylococcus sp. CAG:324]HAR58418.1 NifU family protein [Acholeplasmatales bacterium]